MQTPSYNAMPFNVMPSTQSKHRKRNGLNRANACGAWGSRELKAQQGSISLFPICIMSCQKTTQMPVLQNEKDESTCAWRKHVACGGQPFGPWLRGHAWRGWQHIRSIDILVEVQAFVCGWTYSSILGLLSVTALQCDAVALMLETLGSNQTLDLGGLGVWLLTLTLWLNLTTDNELADLNLSRTSLAI